MRAAVRWCPLPQATRTHEDFLWLHEQYHRSGKYDGLIIPPSPPKPDFSQSHGKLAKLQAGDDQMPQAELKKLKQEIQRCVPAGLAARPPARPPTRALPCRAAAF